MISEVKTDKHIERRIIIGMIVSTDYLSRIRKLWNPQFFTSEAARILSTWCIEYFDKYGKAPQNDIDDIFCDRLTIIKYQKMWLNYLMTFYCPV